MPDNFGEIDLTPQPESDFEARLRSRFNCEIDRLEADGVQYLDTTDEHLLLGSLRQQLQKEQLAHEVPDVG